MHTPKCYSIHILLVLFIFKYFHYKIRSSQRKYGGIDTFWNFALRRLCLKQLYIWGWSQKKCTRWQNCVNNDAIFPAISAVALETFWKLVKCISSPEVCARGKDRALKWRLFVSQVPWLMTISARTSKLKYYAGKLQRRSTVRWWKCVVWKLLIEAQFHAGLSAFVREVWA